VATTYTYDTTTAIGQVRLLIDDRDMSSISLATPLEQRSVIFSDEELAVFLVMEGDSVLAGAARALETMATNRMLFVVSRRMGRTSVDYGGIRTDLLKMAAELRQQAVAGSGAPSDGIVEAAWTDFAMRDIILRQSERIG
jgi:hypothetical protein